MGTGIKLDTIDSNANSLVLGLGQLNGAYSSLHLILVTKQANLIQKKGLGTPARSDNGQNVLNCQLKLKLVKSTDKD